MIGTSTNLVIQGLLRQSNREEFNFFEPFPMGIIMVSLSFFLFVFVFFPLLCFGVRSHLLSGGVDNYLYGFDWTAELAVVRWFVAGCP